MASDDDSLSSTSSDEEFLTLGENGESQDREALIRKKLLESFYGKSSVEKTGSEDGETPAGAGEPPREEKDDGVSPSKSDDDIIDERGKGVGEAEDHGASDDLDSPYFDPSAHTSRHVLGSSVHTLLETEEVLALQVRTLDSTMQTLVYENYSKFIDATDAIRSIGVSVHANEPGLARLSKGMEKIEEESRDVEEALGTLRDAVAEKLRVKRLLTRLDSLLKLPTTLKQHAAAGKYRLATTSFLSAHAILSKHSTGFESLKTIELDCHAILTEMVKALKHKLLYWSGQSPGFRSLAIDMDEDDIGDPNEGTETNEDKARSVGENEEWVPPPEPPKTIGEIFECAGTLFIVLPKDDDSGEVTTEVTFDSGLTPAECKALALSSGVRFLERILDTHQVELLEDKFGTSEFTDEPFDSSISQLDASEKETIAASRGSNLIPSQFLNSMLEAATLFGVSFSIDGAPRVTNNDRQLLMNFVSEAYSTFLGHVRSVLLQHSLNASADDDEEEKREELEDEEEGDAAYSEVSGAMTHLLHSVRELATGLALPDVGVDVDFASSLVSQAVEVTETMVQRRVAQKFLSLRVRVVKECLAPFIRDALAHPMGGVGASNASRVLDVVQIASVALSDGLQLIDDTIRSILTGGVVISDLKGVNYAMVKLAVQGCCRRFAVWLAATLEVLAGCDSSDPDSIIEVPEDTPDPAEDAIEEDVPQQLSSSTDDDVSDVSDQQNGVNEKIEAYLDELCAAVENAPPKAGGDLVLSIAEMCRLAHRSVIENINQSIASTENSGRKRGSSDIFHSKGATKAKAISEKDELASDRFLLAASRALGLYAMDLGFGASEVVCKDFHEVANAEGDDLPPAPRHEVVDLLEIVKHASIHSAIVFGGDKRAGPVPDPPEDEAETLNTGSGGLRSVTPTTLTGSLSTIKGLQLDVERMFIEKVPTFPHPSQKLDFTRGNVVTNVMKVAFHSMLEMSRLCTFTTKGYRQVFLDVEFIRFMLPHYVKDDVLSDGGNSLTILDNILNDVKKNAGERCRDIDCVDQTSFYNPTNGETTTIQSIIRDFMAQEDDPSKKDDLKRFIIEDSRD